MDLRLLPKGPKVGYSDLFDVHGGFLLLTTDETSAQLFART